MIVFGSALAGIGAFVYVLVSTRSLGLEGFSPISHLWTVWAIAAAVVTFSTQVVTVRREVLVGRTAISRMSELMPLLILLAIVIPVLTLYRVQIFGDSNALWPIIGILIPLGSFATGRARGWLAVHGSSAHLAGVVGGENLVRGVIAIALALIDAPAIWYGLAILAGYSVALVALRGIKERSEPGKGASDVGDRWIPASASTAGICDLLLLVTAPTVLATSSDNPALVSALFVAMAVYRVPYQFVLGLIPSLTRTLTETLGTMPASEVRRWSIRVGTWFLLACVAAALFGLLVGESIIAPIFVAQGQLDPIDHALAAVLSIVATIALICSVALLTVARSMRVMTVWIAVTLVTISFAYSSGGDATRVISTMIVGLGLAVIALGLPFIGGRGAVAATT